MIYRVLAYTVIAIVVMSLATMINVAKAQEVPSVVAVDLDKTTVYRGYQWVEVTAYVYIPPGGSIVSLSGVANLSAGITTTTPLAWVVPVSPVTKTVGNITYTISNLLIARIHVPFGAIAGRGELLISISLVARVGNTTYSPSYTYRFAITILDHTVVERTRIEALLRLDNARTTLSLLEAIGGAPIPEIRSLLANLSDMFNRADTLLYSEGEVSRAMGMYETVIRESTGAASQAIAIFVNRQRESSIALDRRLLSIEANISAASARISALERSVELAANAIRSNEASIRSVAQALANYSSTINTYLSTLDRSIVDTNKKIDDLAQSMNAGLANMSRDLKSRLDSFSSALSTIQLALVVLAVVMLAGFVILAFVRRK
jgi:hypothetical protein